MAERLPKISVFGEYKHYHFTAAQSDTAIDSNTHGHFLGHVVVGKAGTSTTITLGDGTTTVAGNVISAISPTVPGMFTFECTADNGLYIAIAGTGMDITVLANPMAI